MHLLIIIGKTSRHDGAIFLASMSNVKGENGNACKLTEHSSSLIVWPL